MGVLVYTFITIWERKLKKTTMDWVWDEDVDKRNAYGILEYSHLECRKGTGGYHEDGT
jgi:hypothetical protein